jgi:hypothetical protein
MLKNIIFSYIIKMTLKVFSMNRILEVNSLSINDIKNEIYNQTGILPENQILKQNSIVLENDKSLSDYNLNPLVVSLEDKLNPIFKP